MRNSTTARYVRACLCWGEKSPPALVARCKVQVRVPEALPLPVSVIMLEFPITSVM